MCRSNLVSDGCMKPAGTSECMDGWQTSLLWTLAIGFALLFSSACSDLSTSTYQGGFQIEPGDIEREILIGVINPENTNDHPSLKGLPESVKVNESFTVEVITYGSSTCTTPDDTVINTEGLTVNMTAFDEKITDSRVDCSGDISGHSRDIELRMDDPGTYEIHLHGVELGSGEKASIAESLEVVE